MKYSAHSNLYSAKGPSSTLFRDSMLLEKNTQTISNFNSSIAPQWNANVWGNLHVLVITLSIHYIPHPGQHSHFLLVVVLLVTTLHQKNVICMHMYWYSYLGVLPTFLVPIIVDDFLGSTSGHPQRHLNAISCHRSSVSHPPCYLPTARENSWANRTKWEGNNWAVHILNECPTTFEKRCPTTRVSVFLPKPLAGFCQMRWGSLSKSMPRQYN